MLIIPFDRALNWRRPPVITILLILVNILTFALWQSGEDEALEDAMSYYASSGLLEMEYPYLQEYFEANLIPSELPPLETARKVPDHIYWTMVSEPDFLARLKSGELIEPGDEQYDEWRSMREVLAGKLAKVTFLEYGLKTAEPTWQSLFAHMFLHADTMHLLGNMFFLLAVGLLVESVLDSKTYLLCYLIAGLGSAGFDFIFSPGQYIPGVGASGAIAGLMGMLTVLYWTRPVRFFYFLFVYFDYIRLPAITLLPLWIGNELFQMFTQPHSNINFLAHLGGLSSGALIGWIIRRTPAFTMEDLDQQDQEKDFEKRLGEACNLCEQYDYKTALPMLRKLNRERPENPQILFNLYDAEKIYPASDEYHNVSQQIFGLNVRDSHTAEMVHDAFQQYLTRAKPKPKLNKRTLCHLIATFFRCGKHQDADKLAQMLAKSGFRCVEQRSIIQELHNTALRNGESHRIRIYSALLEAQAE